MSVRQAVRVPAVASSDKLGWIRKSMQRCHTKWPHYGFSLPPFRTLELGEKVALLFEACESLVEFRSSSTASQSLNTRRVKSTMIGELKM